MLPAMSTPTPQSPLDPSSTPVSRLEVVEANDHRVVFLNGYRVAQYRRNDRGTERVVATQLAEVVPLPDRDIASIFGMHPVSLSRFRGQARSGGAQALMPLRPGPRGPSKVTPQMQARMVRLHETHDLSARAIAQRLSRGSSSISHVTVAQVLRRHRAQGQVQALPMPAMEETKLSEPPPAVTMEAGGGRYSRYAGALLLFAALGRLDVWGVLRQLGAQVGRARRYGWSQTVAAVVFCFALRFRSIEDSKNALHEELGVLIGEARFPGVQSLRMKIQQLSEGVEPARLSEELFRRYLALEPVWEGLYYVDGHFCPYYGQHPTPQGWNPQRRLAMHGHTDVYVHDARGRALFFLSQPLNNSLARAIAGVVEQIRRVHSSGAFTLVFDRGGYSGKLFRWLNAQGIGFITYLKGRKARRRYPREWFRQAWFSFEEQRHYYWVYEKRTRVLGAGLLRTIMRLDDGEQIPVLTNLSVACKPARVVHCLRLRWRQENSLKYLNENYAIDQIIQYGAVEETEERLVANPKRARLQERVGEVRQEIEALEAELGRAVDQNDERRRRTARGVKIAHARLRRKLSERRQLLAQLENRLRHTPAQLSSSELNSKRALLKEDRRLIVNALKLVACNAERVLALQFNRHYQQDKDVFSVFRALFHLSGTVERRSEEVLEVRLQRPEPAKVAQALEVLLQELNAERPRMLGDGPVLQFSLGR